MARRGKAEQDARHQTKRCRRSHAVRRNKSTLIFWPQRVSRRSFWSRRTSNCGPARYGTADPINWEKQLSVAVRSPPENRHCENCWWGSETRSRGFAPFGLARNDSEKPIALCRAKLRNCGRRIVLNEINERFGEVRPERSDRVEYGFIDM